MDNKGQQPKRSSHNAMMELGPKAIPKIASEPWSQHVTIAGASGNRLSASEHSVLSQLRSRPWQLLLLGGRMGLSNYLCLVTGFLTLLVIGVTG